MWVGSVGRVLLWLALAAALAAAAGLFAGERAHQPRYARWGRLAFASMVGLVAAASVLLLGALATNDFHMVYVEQHSSLTTPLYYRLGAFWGGQQGSLLLWLLMLCLYGAWVLVRPPREGRHLVPYALSIVAAAAACFTWLVAAVASPFQTDAAGAANGLGLNNLLHNEFFLLHPLALYLGDVGFTIPFAFAMAGLLRGEAGDTWIRVTHRWALTSWALLSAGILLGAHWSFEVIGWNGYWTFDPVENTALMPWLLSTAFIHSAMIQERRGLLKVWNAGLISAAYVMTLFGTFITRSGVIQSIHAFAQSPIGGWLIGICGLAAALAVYLIGSRSALLADERRLESLVSKEGAFLLNNVVFLSLTLTVLVGTVLPLLTSAFGPSLSVGMPYFTRATAPLFTVLLLLAGVGPLLAWRRASWRQAARQLLAPLAVAVAFAAVLAAARVGSPAVVVGLSCAVFAAAAVLYDFAMAVTARRTIEPAAVAVAAWRLVSRNPRRYGGYAVHLGIAVIACGVVASQAMQREYSGVTLAVGQTADIGSLQLTYEGLGDRIAGDLLHTYARLDVTDGGHAAGTLLPAVSVGADQATADNPNFEPAIRGGLGRDLYVTLEGYTTGGSQAVFDVVLDPLVDWIWFGGALLIAGAVFSLWPRPEVFAAPRSNRVFALWSELEYDWRMGKTNDADYAAMRARYAAMAESALAGEGPSGGRRRVALEERIAARLRAIEGERPGGDAAATGVAAQGPGIGPGSP